MNYFYRNDMSLLDDPPLYVFEWHRDPAHYVIRGGDVVGLSGAKDAYTPAKEAAIHREFLAVDPGAPSDLGGDGGGAALLAFVSKYGPLRDGPQTVNDFWDQQRRLHLYVGFAHDDPAVAAKERAALFNRLAPSDIAVQMAVIRNTGRTTLQFAPRSLLAWMWLMFAEEKAGALEYRNCDRPECSVKFLVGAGVKSRKSKRYCSDSCRALHHQALNPPKDREPKAATKAAKSTPRKVATKKGATK